jgi:hypothetical protein
VDSGEKTQSFQAVRNPGSIPKRLATELAAGFGRYRYEMPEKALEIGKFFT